MLCLWTLERIGATRGDVLSTITGVWPDIVLVVQTGVGEAPNFSYGGIGSCTRETRRDIGGLLDAFRRELRATLRGK